MRSVHTCHKITMRTTMRTTKIWF